MGFRKHRVLVAVDYASDVSKPSIIDVPEEIKKEKDMGIEIQNYPYLPIYVHQDEELTFLEIVPNKQEDII